MSKEKVNTLKLGLFVLTASLLFVVAVYLLGNAGTLFRSGIRLYAVFQHVHGLKTGNNVRYAGIEAGVVRKILITSDSTIEVEMVLQKQMQSIIKTDAVASIGSDGLVGNKIININPGPGNGSAPLVNDRDIIRSFRPVDSDQMLAALSTTNANLALFSSQLLKIADQINTGNGTVQMLLRDSLLAADLRQSLINLKITTGSLHRMGTEMEQALVQLNQGNGLMHDLLYDTMIMADLHGVSEKLADITEKHMTPAMREAQQTTELLARSSADLQEMIRHIRTGQGVVGTLLYDPALEHELKESLSNIHQSTQRFNENMEAMRHNFLFKGYFKKRERQ